MLLSDWPAIEWQDIEANTQQERLLKLLKCVAPDIFSDEVRPCYILDWRECKTLPINHCYTAAFASRGLSLLIKPDLDRLGLWKGEGNLIAIDESKFNRIGDKYYAVGCHEAGHVICQHLDAIDPTSIANVSFPEMGEKDSGIVFNWLLDRKDLGSLLPKWKGHEWKWIRIVLHLAERCKEIDLTLRLDDCVIAGDRYGLSEAKWYYSCLVPELESSLDKTFAEITSTRPPEKFCHLWHRDTGLTI